MTYSIQTNVLNGSSPLFAIDSATGKITLTSAGVSSFANDFETLSNSHQIVVRVSDGTGSTDVTVDLTETNTAEGSISGRVTTANGNAQANLSVTLYDATNQALGTTTTTSTGNYTFSGLVSGTYSVRFGNEHAGLGIKGKSVIGHNGQSEVTEVVLAEAVPLTSVDGFVVDPSGVVYDSVTRQPVAGAIVKIYVTPTGGSRRLVANTELDTDLGDANGVSTGDDGIYSFLLKDTAPSGLYEIVASHSAYVQPSDDIPPTQGPYQPGLGGGMEAIQSQATAPTGGQATTYYTLFNFVFAAGNPSSTSNGVINNHIPLDPIRASMTVAKTVSEAALSNGAAAGDILHYTVTATNTGNVSLADVSATDTLTGTTQTNPVLTPSVQTASDTSFDPGDVWSWTVDYTLVDADITTGQIENYASVSGVPPSGDDVTVYSAAKGVASNATTAPASGDGVVSNLLTTPSIEPAFSVTKSVDETALSDGAVAGDVLVYTISAANTGNVTLTSVVISDPLTGDSPAVRSGASASDISFDSGDVWSWTIDYPLTQADLDAGLVENYASVSATAPDDVDLTIYSADQGTASTSTTVPASGDGVVTLLPSSAALRVVKSETTGHQAVGETLSWDIVVTNTGNVTVSGVTLSSETLKRLDADGTSLTLSGAPEAGSWPGSPGVLAPDASVTFTASYDLTQADIDAGGVANLATASGTAPDATSVFGTSDSDADTVGNQPTATEIEGAPELSITKTVDETALQDGVRLGDELIYTITIENTGNVTVDNLQLIDTFTDVNGGSLTLNSPPVLPATSIAVGDKWEIEARFALTQAALTVGGVKNIALIKGKAPDGDDVQAESRVEGNTSSTGDDGTPTGTGFPGEISGRVLSYLAGTQGVTVYLLRETAPGSGLYSRALDDESNQISTMTDAEGNYVFLNLPPGTYGVEFQGPNAGNSLAAQSATADAAGNRITGIMVDAGAVEPHQNAFFVDPAGVIYDSETFAPIAGARVTLLYNGNPVPEAWLNTDLGDANGVLTGADGAYFFLFDPSSAPSGTYTLVVEKSGYEMSRSVMAATGSYTPGLGGGIEPIIADAVPAAGVEQRYYLAFNYTFTADPASTSNGISNNHIPMDADIAGDIKDEVIDILKDDLVATMTQQAQRMQDYAAGALSRLKSRDGSGCEAALHDALQQSQIHFATGSADLTFESGAVLDAISQILGTCPDQQFEVAGHTDNVGEPLANLALSRARVDAVIAALQERGVAENMLKGRGYGDTRPVADNATEIGRAANRRIEFLLLDPAEDQCENSTSHDHAFNADIQGGKGTVDGTFQREVHDCADDSWKIWSADASVLSTERGVDQSMLNFSVRSERFVTEDRVRGRFLGAYAARSTVAGRAEGEILGFGVNAGLYGADRLSHGLYFDYYLGAAAGRHSFDLDFDRVVGVINATGAYSYGALFAGAALSGETKISGLAVSPRVGVDLAWSPGGKGSLDAVRGALRDSESLTIPAVMGGRAFVEVRFEDLLSKSPIALSVTPRLLCDWGMGELSMGCGYGGTIELTNDSGAEGTRFGLTLEGAQTDGGSSGAIALQAEWALGAGRLKGGVQAEGDGTAGVTADYTLEF